MLLAGFGLSTLRAQSGESKSDAARHDQAKTIVGCLTGEDGHYTLGTSDDMLYLLEGDTEQFKHLNAKTVRATGTVSGSSRQTSKDNVLSQQPPMMKVTSLKKVADGCN